MVKEYLADSRVLLKNAKDETFAASLRVFVQHEQTPIQREPQVMSSQRLTFEELCSTFRCLQQRSIENGEQRRNTLLVKKRYVFL